MNSEHSDIEERSARFNHLAEARACLLFVNAGKTPTALGARQAARPSHHLVLDVDLIDAEDGPWMGAAMPGSANGCGIFAGDEPGEYRARSDDKGIYLAATLDQLLSAN